MLSMMTPTPETPSRSSLAFFSASPKSAIRHSIRQAVSSDPKITLSHLLLACLRRLNNLSDASQAKEHDETMTDIKFFLDKENHEEIEQQIQQALDDFSKANHLNEIIILSTHHCIAEERLQKFYKTHQDQKTRLRIWQEVIQSIRSQANPSSTREDILTYANDSIAQIVATFTDKQLGQDFACYLNFKLEQSDLVEQVSRLNEQEDVDSYFSTLMTEPEHSQDDLISPSIYLEITLRKFLKEPACAHLETIFQQGLKTLNVRFFLTQASIEEKQQYLAELEQEKARLDDTVAEKVGASECLMQQSLQTIQQQSGVKKHSNRDSISKKLLQDKLDLLQQDENGKTALDLALEFAAKSKNIDIVKQVLLRAEKDRVLETLLKLDEEPLTDDEHFHHLRYLARHTAYSLGLNLTQPVARELFPDKKTAQRTEQIDDFPLISINDIDKTEPNILSLILENIINMERERRDAQLMVYKQQNILKKLLNRAVALKNYGLVADVLKCARLCDGLQASIEELRITGEALENLIAEVYLVQIKARIQSNQAVLTVRTADTTLYNLLTNCRDKNSNQQQQLDNINKKLLARADEDTLAYFIEYPGETKWSTVCSGAEKMIRQELQKRYVDSNTPMPKTVKDALQKKMNIKQKAEKLADFYSEATHHLCQQHRYNPELYKRKMQAFQQCFTVTIKTDDLTSLSTEADSVADTLLQNVEERRPWSLPDPHPLNKTQRLMKVAQARLKKQASLLTMEPTELTGTLTKEQLDVIPITYQETNQCIERAALARGAFKKTLEYLARRSYGTEKSVIMNSYLQSYINDCNDTGANYDAQQFIRDLETASKSSGALGKRISWGMWASKTRRILSAELKASRQLLQPA